MKVFIINGGQEFAHSGGKFNETLTGWTVDFFTKQMNVEMRIKNINEPYDAEKEVENFVWADLVVYHTPVWWFQVPYKLKEYIDLVFTAGHQNGIYKSDGRSRANNPKLHYGTGGMMQGKHYMITTSWNAPIEAFEVEGEFFYGKTEDDILIGLHKMSQFAGMTGVEGFHFHEMEKEVTDQTIERDRVAYTQHLEKVFKV